MSGLVLDLASLGAGLSHLEERTRAAELDLPEQDWPGWVEADLKVDRTGDLVSIRAQVRAVARLECVRCLKVHEAPLTADFRVVADRSGSARGLEADLERDDYMKFHDGRRLDLGGEARESLLLALPLAPHCREDCRGLCPRCGADLNEGPWGGRS
jgi:uncharacterized protein